MDRSVDDALRAIAAKEVDLNPPQRRSKKVKDRDGAQDKEN